LPSNLSWETVGTRVNEGPSALYKNGRTFLTFSASGCAGGSYALGLLELTGSDPLKASSWTKKSTPVFSVRSSPARSCPCILVSPFPFHLDDGWSSSFSHSQAANGAYAPGHNVRRSVSSLISNIPDLITLPILLPGQLPLSRRERVLERLPRQQRRRLLQAL
jgi:hypothetical protein